MKKETRVSAETAIEKYRQDYDLHGRDAWLEANGTVTISLWVNKNCYPEIYKGIPVQKFINMAKQQLHLPDWRSILNLGYRIEDGVCGKYYRY